jgi:hypothetical protein
MWKTTNKNNDRISEVWKQGSNFYLRRRSIARSVIFNDLFFNITRATDGIHSGCTSM